MLTAADVLLLALLLIGLPLRAWFGMRRLRATPPAERPRLRPGYHLRGIVTQWAITALFVALWLWRGRSFALIGLARPYGWGFYGVLLGTAIAVIASVRQLGRVAESPDLAGRLRGRLSGAEALLPHARGEWPRFALFAVTAGICEELLFRGFVLWVLAHAMPFYVACAAQAVVFGVAHAYQGPSGMLRTGLVGAFLMAVILVSGSLWCAMLLHAFIDLYAGQVALQLYTPEDAAPEAA